jgi:hypothetical protein
MKKDFNTAKSLDEFVAAEMEKILQNSNSEKKDDETPFEGIRSMYDFLLKEDFNVEEFERMTEQFHRSLITLTANENLIETRQRINLRLTRLQAKINEDINNKKINRLKYNFRIILIEAFPELIRSVPTSSVKKKTRVKPMIRVRTSRKTADADERFAYVGSQKAKNDIDAENTGMIMDRDRQILQAAGGGKLVSILWGKVQNEIKVMREAAHAIAMRTHRENKSADDEFIHLTYEKFIGIVNGTMGCTRGTLNTLLQLAKSQ